ncbi:hypothetical protein MMC09_000656 [Bachmanniomyces sp. S44760]|nr:hypothetical protein [Bachmanniomyces sp. S44760]
MTHSHGPVVLECDSLTEFFSYVQRRHCAPSTVIICSSREEFLEALEKNMSHDQNRDDQSTEDAQTSHGLHHLLIPTIHLVASSRTIDLAFVPDLMHLKAYLALYSPPVDSVAGPSNYHRPGDRSRLLSIIDILGIHRSTSDYSAQGLSRTLASAVDAADRAEAQLVLMETMTDVHDIMPEESGLSSSTRRDPWKEQVPLLNGSLRLGDEQRFWAGRTIEIRKIVARWCRFERLSSQIEI